MSKAIVKLDNQIMIKLGDDWVEILFNNTGYDRSNSMMHEFKTMKVPEKAEDYEINISTSNSDGLDLKPLA